MDMDKFKTMTFEEVYDVLEKSDGLEEKLEESERAREVMREHVRKTERVSNDAWDKVSRLDGILKESEKNRTKAEEHLVKANKELENLHDRVDEKRLEAHKAQVVLKKIRGLVDLERMEKEADEVKRREEDTPPSHQ